MSRTGDFEWLTSEAQHFERVSVGRFSSKLDCWEEVFKFLNYRSRAHCGMSCKCVSVYFEHFFNSETHFDVDDVRPAGLVNLSAWSATVAGVCSQIGASLRTIRMSSEFPLSSATFNTVIDRCENIERIKALSPLHLAGVRFDALAHLKEISFSQQGLWSFEDIRHLGRLPQTLEALTGLVVQGIGWSDRLLKTFFPRFSALRIFELADLDYEGRAALLSFSAPPQPIFDIIVDSCPHIERLGLIDCVNVSVAGVERFSNLKALKISGSGRGAAQLSDDQVEQVCSRNRALESLRIAGRDWSLGTRSYEAISTLAHLCELEMSACRYGSAPKFTDTSLRLLLNSAVGQTLRNLSLLWPEQLTADAWIDIVTTCCPKLRMLVVSSDQLSPTALRRFIEFVKTRSTEARPFQLYIGWENDNAQAADYAALIGLTPSVVVRRFRLHPVTLLADTVAPRSE